MFVHVWKRVYSCMDVDIFTVQKLEWRGGSGLSEKFFLRVSMSYIVN